RAPLPSPCGGCPALEARPPPVRRPRRPLLQVVQRRVARRVAVAGHTLDQGGERLFGAHHSGEDLADRSERARCVGLPDGRIKLPAEFEQPESFPRRVPKRPHEPSPPPPP